MVTFEELTHAGRFVDGLSGVVLVALGLFVGLLRPRTRLASTFGIFAVSHGLWRAVGNFGILIAPDSVGSPSQHWILLISLAVSAVAMVSLAFEFPERPRAGQGGAIVGAVGAGIVVLTVHVALSPPWVPTADGALQQTLLGSMAYQVAQAASVFFLFMLALRYRRPWSDRVMTQMAVVAAAFLVFYGFTAATWAWQLYATGSSRLPGELSFAVSIAIAACLWVANTISENAKKSRLARNVSVAAFAAMTAGVLVPWLTDPALASNLGGNGLTRIAAVAVLAYATLKLQLFDVDVRVKWTLRQGTVAAIFLAVFFITSELAAHFLEGVAGPVVGIVAAGALVFLLAPLQRFADRVADTAMPGVRSLRTLETHDRERLYGELARAAWRDGTITRGEREMLSIAAQRLGLDVEQVHRIEDESTVSHVEADTPGADPGARRA